MTRFMVLLVLVVSMGFDASADPDAFEEPVDVKIEGYSGHAMEPFISRSGDWLFFNNRNLDDDQTDIHIASRIDETHFKYLGVLLGTRSEHLDGVPSLARDETFYFISPRIYDQTKNTIWQGEFKNGEVTNVRELEGDVPRRKGRWVNIDAEISADGSALYFVESRWRIFGGGPKSADIQVAHRDANGAFLRAENSEEVFGEINTNVLEFAPATTADQRVLYFTRADLNAIRKGKEDGFGIFVSIRDNTDLPFSTPTRIQAIRGYVEAPTISPDECGIYFHKRIENRFRIQLARKKACD